MADPGGEARRYCSVCGYLSSEPMLSCPRCSLSTTHVPQVASVPISYAPEWSTAAAGRGPPAWIVIGLILVLVAAVILVTLALDGVFNAPPGEVLAPAALWASWLR